MHFARNVGDAFVSMPSPMLRDITTRSTSHLCSQCSQSFLCSVPYICDMHMYWCKLLCTHLVYTWVLFTTSSIFHVCTHACTHVRKMKNVLCRVNAAVCLIKFKLSCTLATCTAEHGVTPTVSYGASHLHTL